MEKVKNNPNKHQDDLGVEVVPRGMNRRTFVRRATATALAGMIETNSGTIKPVQAVEVINPAKEVPPVDETNPSLSGTGESAQVEEVVYPTIEVPPDEVIAYVSDLCEHPYDIPWSDAADEMFPIDYRKYCAEKAGLTSLEVDESLSAIEHAQSLDELLQGFEVFTRQFGAEVTLADNWRFPEITPEEREAKFSNLSDVEILKRRFHAIVIELCYVPLEVFQLSGIEKIHFTEILSDIKVSSGKPPVTAGSTTDDGKGEIKISLDVVYHEGSGAMTMRHEVGHLLDYAILGSRDMAHKDQAFIELNRPGFKYLNDRRPEAEGDGLIRAYGGRNAAEDKAVIFERTLSGVRFALANSKDDVVREKYRFQLARLEQQIPNVAPYLVAIGDYNRVA